MSQNRPHLIQQKYRPDIDGLRAIAILSVVGFHVFPGLFHGGFIGVDIFFVISGFLISKIIFSSLERDRFSIAEFYLRRIRRIFPALIAVLLTTLFLGWYVLVANEYQQLGKHIAAGAGYVSNFLLWTESGYFDYSAATKPLLHLWSLAIEEQFYIFWPLMLVFVWKRQWNFLKITVFIAVTSFLTNIYLVNTKAVSAFYMPQSRFWELMIGGILAYLSLHHPQLNSKFKNGQSVFGCVLLVLGLMFSSKYRAFPGWWALLPTVGTFFIISAGANAWINKQLLSNKLMVWFGLISYPLYLWHWPLLSFSQIVEGRVPPGEIRIAAAALAVLLAWLTYKFIEEPIRFGMRPKLKANVSFVLMSAALGTGILVSHGYIPARNNNRNLDPVISAFGDWNYFDQFQSFSSKHPGSNFVASNKIDKTLFIGDSHVQQYAPRVADVVKKNPSTANTAVFVTGGDCPPIPDVFDDARPNYNTCIESRNYGFGLINRPDVKTVVIGACWNCYFVNETKKDSSGKFYALVGGKKNFFSGGEGSKFALQNLERFLTRIGKSKKVYLLLDNPEGAGFSPQSFIRGSRLHDLEIDNTEKTTKLNRDQQILREKLIGLASRSGVEIIDPISTICSQDGNCMRMTEDGNPIYADTNHMRPFFVREFANYIDNTLYDTSVITNGHARSLVTKHAEDRSVKVSRVTTTNLRSSN